MSEHINNVSQRKEALKEVIKRLHAGESVEDLKIKFGDAIKGATAGDIAEAERTLISEGVSVSEIQRLCDLHVAVFQESLDEESAPESLPGHPVFTFRMENEVTMRLLEAMKETITKWRDGEKAVVPALQKQAEDLKSIEKHYSRKENLLFPYLEKKDFEGPSQVMWGVDNQIREQIKEFNQYINSDRPEKRKAISLFNTMAKNIQEMIYKEEKILFPEALTRLTPKEWGEIRNQEDEIGYFNVTPRDSWQPEEKQEEASPEPEDLTTNMDMTKLISLSTGSLTQEQIDLMLTHLPIDITYVDENDRVRYFTQGRERIFDRSPSIIGREVIKCHPPQSVDKVVRILEDFRTGKRDVAEFWIQMGSQFIHIRYFALHNDQGEYKGCIEVSQNVTHIRALKGEKRLLDDLR